MKLKTVVACFAIAAAVAVCAQADAAQVIYDFEGVVSVGAPAGSMFRGRLVFESTTPDSWPTEDRGFYVHPTPLGVNGVRVEVDSVLSYQLGQDSTYRIGIEPNAFPDRDVFNLETIDHDAILPQFPDLKSVQIGFDLSGADGMLADDSLITNLSLGMFTDRAVFSIQGFASPAPNQVESRFFVLGNITSLTPVPEPSSMLLVAVGAAAAFGYRFCRKQS